MKEDVLVKPSTAILAKEKGFDYVCSKILDVATFGEDEEGVRGVAYWEDSKHSIWTGTTTNTELSKDPTYEGYITIPTQALLAKWLRDEHKIALEICLREDPPFNEFYARKATIGKYFLLSYESHTISDTYEQALEQGLISALNEVRV